MKVVIERNNYNGYRDMRWSHALNAIFAFFWVSIGYVFILIPVFYLSSVVSTDKKDGWEVTAQYMYSVFVSTIVVYLVVMTAILNGLMFTSHKRLYIFTEVPKLILSNKKRFFTGLSKSVAIPLVFLASYWVMVQRIPIVLPPYGVFSACALISASFALKDAYRMYRDDLTILDSFVTLMPRKMVKSENNPINKVPFSAYGNGVLFSPFLQSFFILVAGMALATTYTSLDNLNNPIVFPWLLVVGYATAFTVWGILFRVIDAFKPWGEKGKLSILKNAKGELIESRAQVRRDKKTKKG